MLDTYVSRLCLSLLLRMQYWHVSYMQQLSHEESRQTVHESEQQQQHHEDTDQLEYGTLVIAPQNVTGRQHRVHEPQERVVRPSQTFIQYSHVHAQL